MSEPIVLEWRNRNASISYPLEENTVLPTFYIVDACFFFVSPAVLYTIAVKDKIIVTVNEFKFYIPLSIQSEYHTSYNDFGKIIVTKEFVQYYSSMGYGYTQNVNVNFVESICYANNTLSINGLNGEVTVVGGEKSQVEFDEDRNIVVSIDEAGDFTDDGIVKINGQEFSSSQLVFSGDPCCKVTMSASQLTVEDICKPPCYKCTERLTSGDVFLKMQELEGRIAALGG